MNDDQHYEQWKRRRGAGAAPAGFADRVMAAIEAHVTNRRQRTRLQALLFAVLSSRLSRIGVGSLAAATCVYRLLHVFAIFVAQ